MSLLDIIFDLPIVTRILDRLLLPPGEDQRKPPCINLYWTLPDNIQVGKAGRMNPACELGLKLYLVMTSVHSSVKQYKLFFLCSRIGWRKPL